MTIGEKLVKLRKEQNLTQEQFAEVLQVSRQSVSKWELNTAYPDTEKLIRISKLFDCSLDYLLKDEIEQMDENLISASESAKSDKMTAMWLTYLSFPPLFGWVVAIFSLRFQFKNMKNKLQIALSIVGMIISLCMTAVMIFGIMFEL
ncbi:MAG: helix-turn-helix domain-containing protein [Oscillospiraceae bacterium]